MSHPFGFVVSIIDVPGPSMARQARSSAAPPKTSNLFLFAAIGVS